MIYRLWDKKNKCYDNSEWLVLTNSGEILKFHLEADRGYCDNVTDQYDIEFGFKHNDIEYYEGDIVKYTYPKTIQTEPHGYAPLVNKIIPEKIIDFVIFENGHFQLNGDKGIKYFDHKINEWGFEIIGNVHQNPELMED